LKKIIGQELLVRAIHWLLAIIAVLFLISGFGITEFRVVEALTFGLLSKSLAFKIHDALWIPFIILLGLHIFFSLFLRSRLKARKQGR
jgi:cytochrome b subunit of formate dehydrogenase